MVSDVRNVRPRQRWLSSFSLGLNAMSENEIWISREGTEFGPYALDDARAYLKSGRIVASDLASTSSDKGHWVPVSTVLGITPPPPPPDTAVSTAVKKWWHGPALTDTNPLAVAVISIVGGLLFHFPLAMAILLLCYTVIALRATRWRAAACFVIAASILTVCKLLFF